MKNARILKIADLIHEVKKIDTIIALHRNLSDDDFMVDQYVAQKNKVFAKLITELANPALASTGSFHLVQQLVETFYAGPDVQEDSAVISDLEELKQIALTA